MSKPELVRLLRLSLFAALSVVVVIAARSGPASDGSGAVAACGTERWTVKTLQDRPSLLPVRTTTIAFLTSRPAPATLPDTRLPFERHVYRVLVAVTLVRQEADSDLHLVLQDAAGIT